MTKTSTVAAAAVLTLVACVSNDPVAPPVGDSDLAWEQVVGGLDEPIFVTTRPGDDRLFVVEQRGTVRIVDNGQVTGTFLDIDDLVQSGGERGLLGMAFHPSHASNGYVYVHYTDNGGDTQVDRYTLSANPDALDRGSRLDILSVSQPFSNHNGGMIAFGPDGMLYVALGDGGSGNDPQGHGQNTGTLLGSLLRLDVDGGTPYAAPGDNPFASGGGRAEIWAYGLRNPWRFSFDVAGGSIYIGDVGQNAQEEIDVAPVSTPGVNYGWSVVEGADCRAGNPCDPSQYTAPAVTYPNPDDGCAVVGGYVYRGSAVPGITGRYFYSDFCGGWLRSFEYVSGTAGDLTEWTIDPLPGIRSFGVDNDGELYAAAGSVVWRLVVAPGS